MVVSTASLKEWCCAEPQGPFQCPLSPDFLFVMDEGRQAQSWALGQNIGLMLFYLVGNGMKGGKVSGRVLALGLLYPVISMEQNPILGTCQTNRLPPNLGHYWSLFPSPQPKSCPCFPKASTKIGKIFQRVPWPLAMSFHVPGWLTLKRSISPTWLWLLASKTCITPALHMTHI